VLHSPRFCDVAPAETYATLLDEGTNLASERTMDRLLAAAGETGERRNQRVHPAYATPELLATGLVMVSLTQIVKQVMGAPQIFILRPPELGRTRTDPERELTAISQHRNIPRAELVAAERQFLDTYRRRQPPL
jgi:hypothetical protein